jgi:hypothetical protein
MPSLLGTNTTGLWNMFESCNEAQQHAKSWHHPATHFSESGKILYIVLGVLDYIAHSGEIHKAMNAHVLARFLLPSPATEYMLLCETSATAVQRRQMAAHMPRNFVMDSPWSAHGAAQWWPSFDAEKCLGYNDPAVSLLSLQGGGCRHRTSTAFSH